MIQKNAKENVVAILEKYLPKIIESLEWSYPISTSKLYYENLRDHLLGTSIGFLVENGNDDEKFLNYAKELIPKEEREKVLPILEKMRKDLKSLKLDISPDNLREFDEKKGNLTYVS